MRRLVRRAILFLGPLLPVPAAAAVVADPFADIRARGVLTCAVSTDEDDYSQFDVHGNVSAFSTDLCRAIAAAIFPSGPSVRIVPTGDEITAVRDVQAHRADIAFGTTPDPALGAALGLAYAPPFLIDGQGFLVNRGEHVADLRGLAGKRICFVEGTPEGETLKTRMAELGIGFTAFPFSERGEMIGALATGHCNAVTGDVTELASQRLSLPALEANAILLPGRITTDPWSAVVRTGETRLLAVVEAVQDGLVSAALLGIGQRDAAAKAAHPTDPVIARLLGDGTWEARGLGLDERFLLRAIETVGNQEELYRRDLGDASPLRLPVGPNAPIEQGGALLSIPVASAR